MVCYVPVYNVALHVRVFQYVEAHSSLQLTRNMGDDTMNVNTLVGVTEQNGRFISRQPIFQSEFYEGSVIMKTTFLFSFVGTDSVEPICSIPKLCNIAQACCYLCLFVTSRKLPSF